MSSLKVTARGLFFFFFTTYANIADCCSSVSTSEGGGGGARDAPLPRRTRGFNESGANVFDPSRKQPR